MNKKVWAVCGGSGRRCYGSATETKSQAIEKTFGGAVGNSQTLTGYVAEEEEQDKSRCIQHSYILTKHLIKEGGKDQGVGEVLCRVGRDEYFGPFEA